MVRCCLRVLGQFREKFVYPAKDVAHYFPSHMSRGLRDMQYTLRSVDCLLEVHDARIPFSGRNPTFKDTLMIRPHILVLNKMDLADMTLRDKITQSLTDNYSIQKVLYTNAVKDKNRMLRDKLVPAILEVMGDSDRHHRANADAYNVMVMGVPNVGKSSLINTLRSIHLSKKKKATSVGPQAGVTRSVLTKIRVSESPKIFIYDTPGIMLPDITDMKMGMKLALCSTLRDHMVGEEVIVDFMLYWLNSHKSFKYVEVFGLAEPTDDVIQLLAQVAKQKNLVVKVISVAGRYELKPHFKAASEVVLRAFRSGALGRFNLDEDILRRDLRRAQR